MEYKTESQQIRVYIIRNLLKAICRTYAMYYKAPFRISGCQSSINDDYLLSLHCPTDNALSAAFLLISSVANEHLRIVDDVITIEVSASHDWLNENFGNIEAENPDYEWKED